MIQSDVYRLSRMELAYVTSEEYVRNYWWFVGAVPAFGLICLIFTRGPIEILGMLAFLWPFSIPARSIILTTKSSRLFTQGCHVEATDGEISVIGEYNNGTRLRHMVATDRLKQVLRRRGMIIIRTRMPGFMPIKESAFESEEQIQAFVNLIQDGIDKWQNAAAMVNQ